MKYVTLFFKTLAIGFVVLALVLAFMAKVAFPGIEHRSALAELVFGFWTLIVPVAMALWLLWRYKK